MENKSVIILGDHHGNYDRIFRLIDEKKIEDCILIHVGDGGEGFKAQYKQEREFELLNSRFKKRNIEYLSIRGNHSDPSYFLGQYKYSNFKLLPDYHTQTINGEKFLFVGGAISIDRQYRTLGHSYWLNEAFVLDESKIVDCDVLITHTPPYWIGPFDKDGLASWCQKDPTLWDDCKKERLEVAELIEKSKAKKHYCGHMHMSSWVDFKDCYSTILAIDEFKEHRSNEY